MSNEPINKFTGRSVSQSVASWPYDLSDIGVGLSHIVTNGRYGFGLKGEALIDYVRRSLYALVERGAKVRHVGKPGDPDREIVLHYGNDADAEVVEGVIADWLASGGGDLEWGDFWFALPGTYDRPKR